MTTQIPSLRFPQFAEESEWEEKKLGEIATFYSGGTPLTSQKEYFNGTIPFIRSGEINDNKTAQFLTEEGLKNSSAKMVAKGDILFALYGATSGEVGISKINGAINQAVLCIRSKHNHYFIYSFLGFNKNIIINTYLQGGQGNLSAEIVKKIKISIPSLAEQTQIGNFLTAVDTRLSLLKQKYELLKSYKKGIMAQIFNQELRFKDENGQEFPEWEEKTLGKVVTIQGGYAFKSKKFNQGQNKVFRIGDILSTINSKNFTGVYSIEKPDNKYLVKKNDFLIALSGATFGKVGKIIDDTIGYINQRVATFRVDNYHCLEFFFQVVQSSNFKNYINSIPSASAQPNISNTDIANFFTFIPCLAEQTKIANFLMAIDNKINNIEQQIGQSEKWKRGLLQAMLV